MSKIGGVAALTDRKIIDWSDFKQTIPKSDLPDELDMDFIEEDDGDDESEEIELTVAIPMRSKNGFGLLKPTNKLNLFEINTNFYIDDKVGPLIELTEGVEVLKLLTPYKGILGVGHLFELEETKKKVLQNVNDYFYPDTLLAEIKKLECSGGKENEHPD